MAIDAKQLLARYCVLEEEATLAIGFTTNAVPRWLYQQERPKYWRNRIAQVQLETAYNEDDGQEYDVYRYTVEAQLVYAEASAGYDGEKDEDLLDIFPQIQEYIDAREVLQSSRVINAAQPYLDGMPYLRYQHFTGGVEYVTFPYGTAGGVQIGSSFLFTCVFDKYVAQAF